MKSPGEKKAGSPSLPPVKIRTGVPAELTLHAVADHELEDLAHGAADSSSYLNFAIFLLSTALSLFLTLLTASVSPRVFTVFVVITTVGFLNGTLLVVVWIRKRRSVWDLVDEIRSRVPAEGLQQAGAVEVSEIDDDDDQ